MDETSHIYSCDVSGCRVVYRDEIQRIKASNPDITHREAFSAAAKNVTLFSSFLSLSSALII
jgi:hypothetical protein